MAEIRPFRAWRYHPGRVRLGDVLTQPYDKITAAMQERYYAASPYNLIPVEKGRALPGDTPQDNVYTRAAGKLREWAAAGILVQDPAPALYAYFQDYAIPGTPRRAVRRGFIALGRLEDYSAGVVFRHERTLEGPRADRLALLRHTRAQTGQLFLLYDDPAGHIETLLEEAARAAPAAAVSDEYGVVHSLWPVTGEGTVARIVAEMAAKRLIIADGHHRYETALTYRDECRARWPRAGRDAPWEFAMMTLVSTRAEGLTILPTHRLVSGLPGFDFQALRARLAAWFDWYAYPFSGAEEAAAARAELRRDLEKRGRQRRAIGAYAGGGAYYLFVLRGDADLEALLPGLSPAERDLDVVLLHRLILARGLGISDQAVSKEALAYERDAEAALAAVDAGRAQACFLLNAVTVEQMARIALSGGVMPQKSTDFYPKLLSGLAIYRMEA